MAVSSETTYRKTNREESWFDTWYPEDNDQF